MASRNSQDGVSLVQTAEGGMQTIQDILQRMRELAVQSSSDTNQELDRGALDLEIQELLKEINQIADTTEFNQMRLMSGEYQAGRPAEPTAVPPQMTDGVPLFIQVGANQNQLMSISIRRITQDGLGLSTVRVTTQTFSTQALGLIDTALNSVSTMRAELGAFQNRLEFKIQNLNNQAENIAAAESRIRDADMAKMMTEFTKNNILFQASTAMLAQANALPQGVLQLLG